MHPRTEESLHAGARGKNTIVSSNFESSKSTQTLSFAYLLVSFDVLF
jgi:hypothetical protein